MKIMASSQVGFSFLLDASGQLFGTGKAVARKDVEANTDQIFCVMKVSRGKGRYSAHVLSQALMVFYEKSKLYPTGLSSDMEVIQNWALKQGNALQKLVSWFDERIHETSTHMMCS